MTNKIRYFVVFNNVSGADLGIFGGANADEAIRAMLDDAGCYEPERADATVEAREVDAADVSEADKARIERQRDEDGWND